MRASGGSITTSVASNKGQSGLLRSHLLDSYPSSDEEDEGKRFEAGRKTTTHQQTLASNKSRKNKKARQPKSAELVVSDTDSVSESEACGATAPRLLQKEYVGLQSSTHRPISSVQRKKAEQGRVPRFQRKVLGDSTPATIKSKAPIVASAYKRKPTAMNDQAMRGRGKEVAEKPARSVMVKKQRVRNGPFVVDSETESDGGSDSGSENSIGVEAEQRGLEEDEDDDDNWDAIPPIKPPERMSLAKRNAVWTASQAHAQQSSLMRPKAASAPSSQRTPAFDKAKLKAMLLANKKNQPKFHASPGESSKGQATSIATKIPAKTDRDSLKSKSDAQPSSASTKPASRSARPAEASLNKASTSGRESGSTQNLSKQHIDSKHNVGTSGAKQLPKCRPVEESSFTPSPIVEPRTSMVMGGVNVLSSTKRALGTSARKPPATAPLPANTEPNLQGPAPKNSVYTTLQKPPKAISNDHETQTVIPKTGLSPTRPKAIDSIQSQTAVEGKAQMSKLKTVAAPKASASVVVPSRSNTVLATPEAKNAADRKSKQHPNSVLEKSFHDSMGDVRPETSATEMQRTVRRLPGNLDKPGHLTERGSTVASVVQPLANDSKVIAKVAEKDQQHQTVASAQSSTSLLTDQPLPHIMAKKATSTVTPQSQPNEPVIARAVGTTSIKSAPDANQSICKGKEKRGDVPESVAPSARPGSPAEVSIHPPKVAQKVPVKGKVANMDTTRKAAEVSHGPNVADLQPPLSLPGTSTSIFNLSSLPAPASDAEPYFEYSIFNRIWSAGGDESSINATELTSTPCTNINEANTHVETLFSNAREQYQQHFSVHFSEWTNKPDAHGCSVFIGTFASIEYPSKKSCMKFWVERHTVSAEAGRAPKNLKHTSFVAKTVYVLRLFRLLPATTDSDGETEDTTGTTASTRVYHQLPRTECYTTLDAANRAAKNLQIEMSHKPNPTKLDEVFQTTNLAELNQKANDLRQAKDEESRYWNSKFHGSGLGSEFELFVEKAGLCGPRNL
ncbi:hypothetical protein SNOG_13708 [Parastagonospora nodorum SN15]|uniref:Uncharacterized protein n=1 Tax=Phaeosphaeria nodorum (strain SN15 / ATCC MYA-4574 / FGSC 10173) TaxID=321614 RepID=Q0U3F6_PHANO|nr:hypothetical protein SNOG_13708 [Parastagonospora nodorum SN15]EAT78732.2 hypothetical protein SNOG_13708 [Parastagonospora nodorum SN15]